MKIVKNKEKFNRFSIENLSMGKVLAIIYALSYLKGKGVISTSGDQLLTALNSQTDKLKLN